MGYLICGGLAAQAAALRTLPALAILKAWKMSTPVTLECQ